MLKLNLLLLKKLFHHTNIQYIFLSLAFEERTTDSRPYIIKFNYSIIFIFLNKIRVKKYLKIVFLGQFELNDYFFNILFNEIRAKRYLKIAFVGDNF